MIKIKNVSKKFDARPVIDGFCCEIAEGERVCFMGPSGCGKTTLLRILLGLLLPDAGSVEGLPDDLSVVFQEDRLCESLTPLANIRLVTGAKKGDSATATHLVGLGLGDSLEKKVSDLSGGMKRRVSIARALSVPHSLLILDEPFKGLDVETKKQTVEYILKNSPLSTVIAVTHDPEDAYLLGARTVVLKKAEE